MENRKTPLIKHDNNFGLLRISFATLVILTHSFYFVDGNSLREPFIKLFHVLSLADISVDGFFIISGYLVTKSYMQSKSQFEYLGKRVLRIYPGYVVACAVSLLIGLRAGGLLPHVGLGSVASALVELLFLAGVHIDRAFASLPYPGTNGSLWSIAYEFRCYLILIVLGSAGLLRDKRVVGLLTFGLLLWLIVIGVDHSPGTNFLLGSLDVDIRTLALFCTGSAFYLFRDWIKFSQTKVLVCIATLLTLLPRPDLATPALAVFGGYAIFWFALHGPTSVFSRAANKVDLSYGVYLYAWPIGELLVWYFKGMSPWAVFGCTTLIAYAVAYLSWTLLENPALGLKRFLTKEHGF
jgi:peptidoglycan/LPS O-acetylase OafA/YrhL